MAATAALLQPPFFTGAAEAAEVGVLSRTFLRRSTSCASDALATAAAAALAEAEEADMFCVAMESGLWNARQAERM
jgi:hypothetical protein